MNISRLIPLFLAGVSGPAVQAVTLPPYPSQVALPGTSVAAQPHLAGTVVEDLLTPFAYRLSAHSSNSGITLDLTGTVQSQVVRAVDGTFDFYWRVLPDAQYERQICGSEDPPQCIISTQTSPNVPLSDFYVGSFNVPEVRADWRSDGPGEAAPRMGIGGPGAVNFQFGEVVGDPPEFYSNSTLRTGIDSYFVFIDTDARAYSKSGVFFLSTKDELYFGADRHLGGRSGLYATFAPALIPEPQTWALMLAGLAGLAGLSRRRRA